MTIATAIATTIYIGVVVRDVRTGTFRRGARIQCGIQLVAAYGEIGDAPECVLMTTISLPSLRQRAMCPAGSS